MIAYSESAAFVGDQIREQSGATLKSLGARPEWHPIEERYAARVAAAFQRYLRQN
jgi:hypothetical protein